jgi:hypothetical protein
MPLEGQWRRVNTPLRRLTKRERNVAIAVVAVTIAGVVALILATVDDSRPAPAPGCISATVAGFTGAEPLEACGARARQICAAHAGQTDPRSKAILEACRRAAVP